MSQEGVMLQSTKRLRACLGCHLIKDQDTVILQSSGNERERVRTAEALMTPSLELRPSLKGKGLIKNDCSDRPQERLGLSKTRVLR